MTNRHQHNRRAARPPRPKLYEIHNPEGAVLFCLVASSIKDARESARAIGFELRRDALRSGKKSPHAR